MDRKDGLLRRCCSSPAATSASSAKVGRFGADVIVIDLEDAVADEEKVGGPRRRPGGDPELRREPRQHRPRQRRSDRDACDDDIAAVVCPSLDAIMVPKVEDAETLAEADRRAGRGRAADRHGDGQRSALLAILETPRGIVAARRSSPPAPDRDW